MEDQKLSLRGGPFHSLERRGEMRITEKNKKKEIIKDQKDLRNFVINYLFEKIALNLYRSHDLCTTDLQMMDPNVKEHRRKGAANCHRKMAGRKRLGRTKSNAPLSIN